MNKTKSAACERCGQKHSRTGSSICRQCVGILRALHPSEYKIFTGMLARCYNKNRHNYHRYGGRGISVCDKWRASFWRFIEDMGPRPSSLHSIDRIDNDGDYAPDNCRWATNKEQVYNTAKSNESQLRVGEVYGDRVVMDVIRPSKTTMYVVQCLDCGRMARLVFSHLNKRCHYCRQRQDREAVNGS